MAAKNSINRLHYNGVACVFVSQDFEKRRIVTNLNTI